MKANHIHLHVRDLERSKDFFKRWFDMVDGPDYGNIVFVCDADGFDLALSKDESPDPLPSWFHWGFKLASRTAVQQLHRGMVAAGVPITKAITRSDNLALFRCADPDGHQVEVYWE